MTSLVSDYLNLNQTSGIVDLFQVDTSPAGGGMVYLTNQATASGTLTFNSLSYSCIPVAMSKASMNTGGTLPQPQLSVAVTSNPLLRATIAAYGDLVGCKVTKFSTLTKYLDAANTTRINILDHSQDFAQATWSKTNTTVTSNAVLAPDGTMTADLILDNATNAQHYISRNTIASALNIAEPVNVSCYVKYGGVRYVLPWINGSSTALYGGGPVIDTLTGEVVGINNAAAVTNLVVTPAGDGWFRVSFTVPANNAVSTFRIYINTSPSTSSPVYVGAGTGGVYVWGAQVQRPSTQQVDASLMSLSNATFTQNVATQTDPFGTFTADILAENTGLSTHFAYQDVAGFVEGQEVSFTIHLRAGSVRNEAMVRFLNYSAYPVTGYCIVNLTTGTITSSTGLSRTPTIVAMTGTAAGWYRVTISALTTGAGSLRAAVMMMLGGTNTYTGTNNGMYLCAGCVTWDTGLKDYQLTTTTHAPYADPTAISPVETYYISQLLDFGPETVTWKLVTPLDRPNLLVPRLQYLKDAVGNNVYAPGLNRVMS